MWGNNRSESQRNSVGLGAPIYSKLDMDLASAMMSINAVKGVNIGSGMNSAQLTGEQNSDEILQKGKKQNLILIMPEVFWEYIIRSRNCSFICC